jgi:hypothetical protein
MHRSGLLNQPSENVCRCHFHLPRLALASGLSLSLAFWQTVKEMKRCYVATAAAATQSAQRAWAGEGQYSSQALRAVLVVAANNVRLRFILLHKSKSQLHVRKSLLLFAQAIELFLVGTDIEIRATVSGVAPKIGTDKATAGIIIVFYHSASLADAESRFGREMGK